MSGFRSLANMDHWPVGSGTGWEALSPGLSAPKRALGRAARAKLSKVVEADIIPRLMLSHDVAEPAAVVAPDVVVVFSRHLLGGDIEAARAVVAVLRKRGVAISAIYCELFTPSARFMGELWVEDICDFTDVTLALLGMQNLVRELAPEFTEQPPQGMQTARRALLVAAPGDDHGFGVQIVREFFRRAGWEINGDPSTYDALLCCTRFEWFDVVGLSVTNDTSIDGLAAIIRAIKKRSANPDVSVMVGGRFFLENPDFVKQVGADATAPDGRRAVPRISSLLDTSALQC